VLLMKSPYSQFVKGRQSITYDPVYSNCEHFATFLVFGKPISLQADHQSKFLTQVLFEDLGVVLIFYWQINFLYKSNLIQGFVYRHKLTVIKIIDEIIKIGKWEVENPTKFNLVIIAIAVVFNFFFLNTFSLIYDEVFQSKLSKNGNFNS